MQNNKYSRPITATLIVIAVILSIIYLNSFNIALMRAGISKKSMEYLDIGIDDNGNDYVVLYDRDLEGTIKLVLLTKSDLGIWKKTREDSGPNSDSDFVCMRWMRFASMVSYDFNSSVDHEYMIHEVYAGNNANRKIDIPPQILPDNVTVNVIQARNSYALHFVTYGDMDDLNIDIEDLLKRAGCI